MAGGEGNVGVGGGIDAAPCSEHLRGHLNCLSEVASDPGEGGDEEVTEAVTLKVALLEAIAEEAG